MVALASFFARLTALHRTELQSEKKALAHQAAIEKEGTSTLNQHSYLEPGLYRF
jgi:hypothetical protein